MDCKHFGSCGSCSLYALNYEAQLTHKASQAKELLAPFFSGELELFSSPDSHYRARAEFRIWHEGNRCSYAMGNIDRSGAVNIEECPKVIESIEKRMWPLLKKINLSSEVLKKRLFAVEFLATTTDECLITMLYHRRLDEAWSHEAKLLEKVLDCKIMGRSRKQKVILSDEFVTETLHIDNKDFHYIQYENSFTQPNPAVNARMIEWAIRQAKKIAKGDFLEAYCGLGNFTLPLSHYFDKVLATEISKRSIHAALKNCELNGIDNIVFARLASEEMTEALQGIREFKRLKGIDLKSYDFTTVLVDPPRAGLDKGTIELISNIENIIYISCNLKTLTYNLEILTQTHEVVEVAIFDQFPHTEHVESGVFLRKK